MTSLVKGTHRTDQFPQPTYKAPPKIEESLDDEFLRTFYPLFQSSAEELIEILEQLTKDNNRTDLKLNAQQIKGLFEQALEKLEGEVKSCSDERNKPIIKRILLEFINEGSLSQRKGKETFLTTEPIPTQMKGDNLSAKYLNWYSNVYYNKIQIYFLSNIGCSVSAEIEYTDEELRFFKTTRESVRLIPAKKLSCFNFALLKVKELRAKYRIFDVNRDTWGNPLFGNPDFEIFLRSLGYTLVKKPQKGDIAVCRTQDEHPKPVHASICLSEDIRLSKLGLHSYHAVTHHKSLLASIYSDNCAYYRKQIRSKRQ